MSNEIVLDEAMLERIQTAKEVLKRCLNDDVVSEEEIRKTQCTFNEIGTYYLRKAIKCFHMMRKLEDNNNGTIFE